MMTRNTIKCLLGAAVVLTLTACETTPPANNYSSEKVYPRSNGDSAYTSYGVIQSIDVVRQEANNDVGLGTLAGAVIGGVVGNQVGGGRGNTAATVVGAAGGAYAGHELEKRNRQQDEAYKFNIRMSDGSYQTVTQSTSGDLRVGDRVQIDNGALRRY